MNVDHNDPALVFEHLLRSNVTDAINTFDREMEEIGQGSATVQVTYRNDVASGVWQCYSYRSGMDVNTKGAMLHLTMAAHIRTIAEQERLRNLPALIAGPIVDVTEEG